MSKKPNLGPDFGLFTPNLEPPKIFLEFPFHELLNIVPSYYRMQFKVKLMNEAWENYKKPNLGPDFDPFAPKLSSQIFFESSSPTSCSTLFQAFILCYLTENEWAALEKLLKNLILDPILTRFVQISGQQLFAWLLPLIVVTDCSKLLP